MGKNKPYLGFRMRNSNRFTVPVLLNVIESSKLDRFFHIKILEKFSELKQFVQSRVPGLLLYSFMTPHLPEIQEEMNWILQHRDKKLRLLAGGPHTIGEPESSLKLGFDFAYVGPAETGFFKVLEDFLQNKLSYEKVVFYAPETSNLDKSLPLTQYIKSIPPLEITRGCYWNCKFCQTACHKAIHRSFDSFKFFYQEVKKRHLHRRIGFICPSAFEYGAHNAKELNPDAVYNLLSYCKSNGTQYLEYGIFPSETRPNSFQEKFVDLIVQFCSNKKITIGAQTGSNRLLRQIRRGHTTQEVEYACEMAYRKGLRPLVDIIFGFPDETSDDRRETCDFIKKIAVKYKARVHVHYFLPLAGTPLYDSHPKPIDYRTMDALKKFQKDGICTGWWETGQQLSANLIRIRKSLLEQKIVYQKQYLSIEL